MNYYVLVTTIVCNNGVPVSSSSEKIQFGSVEGRDRFVKDIQRVNEEGSEASQRDTRAKKYANCVHMHYATLSFDSAA